MLKCLHNKTKTSKFALSLKSEMVLQWLRRRHHTGVLVRSGYSSIYILLPRTVSYANGGPSHMWLDGLQRQRTLKTCFSEFHHITSAPFYFPCKTRSTSSTSSVRQRMRFLYLPLSTKSIIKGQTGTSSVQNCLPIKIIGEA